MCVLVVGAENVCMYGLLTVCGSTLLLLLLHNWPVLLVLLVLQDIKLNLINP